MYRKTSTSSTPSQVNRWNSISGFLSITCVLNSRYLHSTSSISFLSSFILSYLILSCFIENVKYVEIKVMNSCRIRTIIFQPGIIRTPNRTSTTRTVSLSLPPSLPSLLPSLPFSPFFSCSHFERIRYQKSDCQSSWDESDCYSLLVEWSRRKVLLYFFYPLFLLFSFTFFFFFFFFFSC